MQGLFGVFCGEGSVAPDLVDRALRKLDPPAGLVASHWRSPDGRVLLGRLGTTILAPEPPLHAEAECVVALEGEFAPRAPGAEASGFERSTTVLAALHSESGDELPERIEGSFAAAVYDRTRDRLLVCNDRFGQRPLYFHHDGRRLVFAPTTRLATLLGDLRPHLDLDALAQFFRYQQILDDRALYQNLALLPPASRLVFDLRSGELRLDRYWDVGRIPLEQPIAWRDAVEQGAFLVRRAVLRRFEPKKRIGLFLSGGIDSRLLLGALGEHAAGIPAVNYGDPAGGDVVHARRVAARAGARFHHFDPTYPGWTREFLEFFFANSYTPLHYFNGGNNTIARQAKSVIDINLSGVMGDAVIGDLHDSHALLRVTNRLGMLDALDDFWGRGHFHPGAIDLDQAQSLFEPGFARELGDRAREALTALADRIDCAYNRRHDFLYLHTRARRCLGNLLHCERSVLENRSPFYDYGLVDYFYSVPYEYRIDRRLQIGVLHATTPRLARLPMAVSNAPPTLDPSLLRLHRWRNRAQSALHRILPVLPPLPTAELSAWPQHTRTDCATWLPEVLLGPEAVCAWMYRGDYVLSLVERTVHGDERAAWVVAGLLSLELAARHGA